MKVLKTIYYLVLGCIGLIAVLLILSVFSFPGNIKFLTVLSGSMEPTIHTGSVVLVKPTIGGDYKVGDIITFGPSSRITPPTTHRIFAIKGNCPNCTYTTKGDANNGPDQRDVRPTDVIGKVRLSAPYAGYALEAARKPYGFLILIIVPAAIIVYDEIRKIIKEARKYAKKKNATMEEGDKKS